MQQQTVSRPAIISVALAVVVLIGLMFWWSTRPRGDARSYSEAVSKLENSAAFQAQQEAKGKAKKEGRQVADPAIPKDQLYQPEDR